MGHKILLADDSITIQKVIELTFSDEDFELHTVGNGQKAIDEIRSIQPDIVLCDIIMPEKNGYEVCEFIKSTDELKHIPVLLLTGAFEPFDQERAKAAGCEGFLAKPFEPQTLISKVKELLAGAQGGGQAAAAAPAAMPEAPAPAPTMPDPALANMSAPMGGDGEETVLVPPPAMGTAPPPIDGPQIPATPQAPPPDMSPGLDEGFAVEAGERELAMDPGDHTVLLGANDTPDVPAPPGASDDIWNDVSASAPPPMAPEPPMPPVQPAAPPIEATPAPPAPEMDQDDGATVFMSEPPPMAPPAPAADLGGPVDNEMNVVGSEDPDATWQMPSDADAPPAAPALPANDLGGFEEFAPAPPAAEPPSFDEPPAMDAAPAPPAPPAMDESPAMAPPLGEDPFTPDPPELGSTNEVAPVEMTPEPIPSVDTQATMDPVVAGSDAFAPLPTTPEPVTPEPPPVAAMSTDSPTEMPAMPTESDTPFTPIEPANEMPSLDPAPPVAPPPMTEPEPVPVAAAPAASSGGDDDLVERVAQRVVDKLSAKVIQEIAWEVVPDLAEGLIQREIDVLKSKIPK